MLFWNIVINEIPYQEPYQIVPNSFRYFVNVAFTQCVQGVT